jgi:hypothetical protein
MHIHNIALVIIHAICNYHILLIVVIYVVDKHYV